MDYEKIFGTAGISFRPLENVARPEKLSKLLREVVADMRLVKNRDHVEFEMSEWALLNSETEKCQVCAAGAYVLAQCFPDGIANVSYSMRDEIADYIIRADPEDIKWGIDQFRQGTVSTMIKEWYALPKDIVGKLDTLFDTMDARHHYDSFDYADVVKWFNTAAAYLESRGY